jgi:3-deoxy-manno-octulosonate cytidylyltransferase (CMP-KDO synthetase)
VLALLGGKPLLLYAVENARTARSLTRVVVATDDERVARAAHAAGVEIVMSPAALPSGSDRAAFAAGTLETGSDRFDVVVNIQADEPFLPGLAVDRAVGLLSEDPEADMATLAVPAAPEDTADPHAVKVVLDKRGRALYFSRSTVPHGAGTAGGPPLLRHVGLYAFRRAYLDRFVGLGPSPLEKTVRLEQLRALEDGAVLRVVVGDWPALGVDTREDLARAQLYLEARARTQRRVEA